MDRTGLPDCDATDVLAASDPLALARKIAVETEEDEGPDDFVFFTFNDHSKLGFQDGRPFTIKVVWDLRDGSWIRPLMNERYRLTDKGEIERVPDPPVSQH